MNKSMDEAKSLLNELVENNGTDDSVEKIIIPAFVFLAEANEILKNSSFKLGGQNCHQEKSGAYTGEVSAEMLKSVGCSYVLVGHSERRLYFREDSDLLSAKVYAALEADLTPIFCVGESLEERKAKQHFAVIKKQITDAIFNLQKTQFEKLVLAYEPVWAIGTGETASPEQAQEIHAFIRKCVEDKYGSETASNIRILYGGSCKPSNADELFSQPDVDGGLIGGASLNAVDFLQIIEAAKR